MTARAPCGANKVTRTKEEVVVKKESRAGAIYTSTPSTAPPPYPALPGELDPEDDTRVKEALYSVIGDAMETV